MDPNTILVIILVIISADYLIDQLLDFINLKNQSKQLPEALRGFYDEEKYQKSLAYHEEQSNFSFITAAFSFILAFLMLSMGGFAWIDQWVGQFVEGELWRALAFFGVIYIASDLLNTPFQLYDTFVIEEKYGFNKTDTKTFIVDKLKGYLLTILMGGLILGILINLILVIGENFWIYFWLVIAAFILFMNMFYASLIVPLFNKLRPLEDGTLKQKIQEYSEKVNFPLQNIYVIDGSKRSTKANAFFSGIGKKKKIVLYDTLIKDHTPDELVAVLAHEVGHFKKRHIYMTLILSVLQIGIMLFILSLMIFDPALSKALGAESLKIHLNLIAFGLLYTPISKVTGILMNIFSRKNEFEADEFARKTYDGNMLAEALKKLSVNNLSNMTPHPAYVFVNYSHPPVLKRLAKLE